MRDAAMSEVGLLREVAAHLATRNLLTADELTAVVDAAVESANAVDVAGAPLRALSLIAAGSSAVAGAVPSREKSEAESLVARQLVSLCPRYYTEVD